MPTLGRVLEPDVEHGVVQSPSHQKLQAEVVDTLAVAVRLALLGLVPVGDEAVAERKARRCVRRRLIAVEHAAGQRGLDMADDLLLEASLVCKVLDLVLLPRLALRFGDGGCSSGQYTSPKDRRTEGPSESGGCTFHALDLAGSKASKGPLVLGSGDASRTHGPLDVHNWSSRRGPALPGRQSLRLFGRHGCA